MGSCVHIQYGIHTHGTTHTAVIFHEDFWGETQCRTQLQVTFPLYGTPHSEGNSLSRQKPTAPLVEVMPVLTYNDSLEEMNQTHT